MASGERSVETSLDAAGTSAPRHTCCVMALLYWEQSLARVAPCQ
jgi:hypothetical protein